LPPLNLPDEVLPNILSVVAARGAQNRQNSGPYWDAALRYDVAEVFGATIQSVDLHDAPLPKTVLPPEADVQDFINDILSTPERVMVHEQLELALRITRNNLLGAVNLCWIGTRFMARGADQRAYPGIAMNPDIVRGWNGELAQFKIDDYHGLTDAPGDNYYFWTHAFGAMAFSRKGLDARLAQAAFSRGTEIMAWTRKYLARRQPNITSHEPASTLGRQAGLMLARLALAPAADELAPDMIGNCIQAAHSVG
jgi:hypothetical protein